MADCLAAMLNEFKADVDETAGLPGANLTALVRSLAIDGANHVRQFQSEPDAIKAILRPYIEAAVSYVAPKLEFALAGYFAERGETFALHVIDRTVEELFAAAAAAA